MTTIVMAVRWLCAGLSVAACATPRMQAADSGTVVMVVTADSAPVIRLARGACHGTCPIYSVQLGANGKVRFDGTRFVRHVGLDSASVSRSTVQSLQRAFAARKFDSVSPVIEYGTQSCGSSYVADLPTNELTLRTSSGLHHVRWDEGCRSHPPMLDSLAQMVDSVTRTSRWTSIQRP